MDTLIKTFNRLTVKETIKRTAGGANTNKNGLSYEKNTELNSLFTTTNTTYGIIFNDYPDRPMVKVDKGKLFKYMKDKMSKVGHAHGCKQPDECYVDEKGKKIVIIEKKFQQCPGSVCEKIQTPDFKIWQYSRLFPSYKIHYVYCLSEWFKDNCKAELDYLQVKGIPIFWGNDINYKSDIVKFIVNC